MTVDYQPVYDLIDEVPPGAVASYGMIASLLPGFTARMVGRSLSHMDQGVAIPWHRIVNSTGAIAPRHGASRQREKLVAEGIGFGKTGKVDMRAHRWRGPSPVWIEKIGADPIDVMEIVAGWRRKA